MPGRNRLGHGPAQTECEYPLLARKNIIPNSGSTTKLSSPCSSTLQKDLGRWGMESVTKGLAQRLHRFGGGSGSREAEPLGDEAPILPGPAQAGGGDEIGERQQLLQQTQRREQRIVEQVLDEVCRRGHAALGFVGTRLSRSDRGRAEGHFLCLRCWLSSPPHIPGMELATGDSKKPGTSLRGS